MKDKNQNHIVEPNKKFSSVAWLSNQTYELFEQYSEGNFDRIQLNKLMLKATEQAKAMHKEEIIKAYMNVNDDRDYRLQDVILKEFAEQYYNETYNK